jgi:hypothetical protein
MDDSPGCVIVRNDEYETETVEDVADIAEMAKGRLQVVHTDESTEFVNGVILGGWGDWKIWLDPAVGGEMEKVTGEDPLAMSYGRLHYLTGETSVSTDAKIKRLKQSNL